MFLRIAPVANLLALAIEELEIGRVSALSFDVSSGVIEMTSDGALICSLVKASRAVSQDWLSQARKDGGSENGNNLHDCEDLKLCFE